MDKLLRIALFVAFFCVAAPFVVPAQSDPLAELEAWNKIKESSLAADYHAFLKKFPNGSLAAQARARMNTIGDPVWNELKKSNDPFKYRDYIKANPDSPFIDQAKARLEMLAPAAIEWEKVKAARDLRQTMGYISKNLTGPFAEEAKASIEGELWGKISAGGTDDLLEFYSVHYAGTLRGKEASTKLQARKAAQRDAELQGIRSRIAALNGVKTTRQQTGGTTGATMWYENKIIDVCTLETTQYEMLTLNPLMYSSETYRIDLAAAGPISSASAFPGTTSVYVTFGGRRIFSGTGHSYSRKSVTKPITLFSSYAVTGSFAPALMTHDTNVAARFAADLNALTRICKASK